MWFVGATQLIAGDEMHSLMCAVANEIEEDGINSIWAILEVCRKILNLIVNKQNCIAKNIFQG